MIEFGKEAYEAYRNAVGARAWNGDSMPTWDEMTTDPTKQHLVSAWDVAGLAAAKAFVESVKASFENRERTMEAAAVTRVAAENGEDLVAAFGKGYAAMLLAHAEAEGILI